MGDFITFRELLESVPVSKNTLERRLADWGFTGGGKKRFYSPAQVKEIKARLLCKSTAPESADPDSETGSGWQEGRSTESRMRKAFQKRETRDMRARLQKRSNSNSPQKVVTISARPSRPQRQST